MPWREEAPPMPTALRPQAGLVRRLASLLGALALAAFLAACSGSQSSSDLTFQDPNGHGGPTATDSDGDGVADIRDNCVFVPNFFQQNSDAGGPPPSGDSWGDVCDNCPNVTNQDQADLDA